MPTRGGDDSSMPQAAEDAARGAFSYLAETDPLEGEPYDAVIGFGMFDLALPHFCGDLYARGLARRIIFTGGIGAGTGNLGGPEADVWRRELARSHPAIPDAHVILENQSTNTGENVAFTASLLSRHHPALAFGSAHTRLIVVASPTRLRRVWLTLRQQHPTQHLTRQQPAEGLETDRAAYAAQGLDHTAQLVGELDRIEHYPAHGWILAEPLPAPVLEARDVLRRWAGHGP